MVTNVLGCHMTKIIHKSEMLNFHFFSNQHNFGLFLLVKYCNRNIVSNISLQYKMNQAQESKTT